MKEPYEEEVANRFGPESCADVREGGGEALTGVRTGAVLSREILVDRGADAVSKSGRQYWPCRYRETRADLARSETRSMCGTITHGNREIPRSPDQDGGSGRIGKSKDEGR
jgi:hypothetical protein